LACFRAGDILVAMENTSHPSPFFAALILVSLMLGSGPARAADQKLIAGYTDWDALAYDEKSGKVCYMASSPQKSDGKYSERSNIYFLVTNRKAEKSIGVVSVIAGYVYKKESSVKLKIGGKEFELFTNDDKAWAFNNKDDKDMVKAMKRGQKMLVTGTSASDTTTADTYSLAGFSAAYDAIGKACDVK